MPANSPLAAVLFLLLLLVGALLPASPVAAGGGSFVDGGGRMALGLHADMARGDISTTTTWKRRRLEEEVAPEFPSAAIAGQPGISYQTLRPNGQACGGNCAARAQGAAYTRPCYYQNQCRQ